ncbi:MAG: S8 family serine peptidase, partial [Dehalococcoidales bacterium]|nr:S8 family serine peptidase [Dehalococcoidales bacterium]
MKGHRLRNCLSLFFVVVLLASLAAVPALAAQPAGANERVKVLIAYDKQPGPDEEALVQKAGGKVKYTYHLVPAIAAAVPAAALAGLAHNPHVERVEPDVAVQAADAELDAAWSVKRIGAGLVQASGNKGAGVKVAIVDSGIDYTHPDLDANYAGGYDFVNNDGDPMDDNGHGTHVAGTVAAADNDSGVVGVAPEASLYALKVLDSSGSGSYSNVVAALEWCVDHGIQVTSNSYGSAGDPGTTVKAAFDAAYAAGIVNVGAAGNAGKTRTNVDNMIYPAKYDSVIAVAATDSSDNRASFSSTGPAAELAAPGVGILSTVPGGGYEAWSGTSMATPHVTGTVALMIAAGIKGRDTIRATLRQTADDLGSTGWDWLFGYGLVDADEAAGITPPPPPPSDTTPPAISNVAATPTSNSATITWTTDELATSEVRYGTSDTDLASLVSGGTLTTAHSLTITGLAAGTTYYYQVASADAASNQAISDVFSFTTANPPSTPSVMTVPTIDLTVSKAGK